jgi:hypothetical protein
VHVQHRRPSARAAFVFRPAAALSGSGSHRREVASMGPFGVSLGL